MKQRMNPVLSPAIVDELRLICMTCSKSITGFYSTHGTKGTCGRACMTVENNKRKEEQRVAYEAFAEKFNI